MTRKQLKVAIIVVMLTVSSREYPKYVLLFGPLHKSTFSKILDDKLITAAYS